MSFFSKTARSKTAPKAVSKIVTTESIVTLPEGSATLRITRRPRLKRMSLRVNPKDGSIQVTAPKSVSSAMIDRFISQHRLWLAQHIAQLAPHVPFENGAEIPILGSRHVIAHDPNHIGAPKIEDGRLIVGGTEAHLARRGRDYLTARARTEISTLAHHYAAQIDKKIRSITLRDTTTRWGSCAEDGKLSFSWRLVLAPWNVLDYVVAHEVAHLSEMNHSARFWNLCHNLTPHTTEAKAWLAQNGSMLLRYGS